MLNSVGEWTPTCGTPVLNLSLKLSDHMFV